MGWLSYSITTKTISTDEISTSSWCSTRNTGYEAEVDESPTGFGKELIELEDELERWDFLSDEALTNFEEALDQR